MMNRVSAFERKLSANPEAKANYNAMSDRAKRVLLDHFLGLQPHRDPIEYLLKCINKYAK